MVNRDDFIGTSTVIRLILRRDKIRISLLILFVVLLVLAVAASFIHLYPDEASRMTFYLQVNNTPTMVALLGALLDSSIGGLTAWRMGFPASLIIGIINVFLMIRQTRSEERKGRLELLNSVCVGRQAALSAALITTFGVNLIIAVLICIGMTAYGLDATSSLYLGMSLAAIGCLFAAITGTAAQLTESPEDAQYLMAALLVIFYIVRVFGWDDGDYAWVSWFSPYGWVHRVQPFAGNETLVFGIFLVFIVSFIVLAYWFSSLRDLGAGIIVKRPGHARASKNLRSSLALAWRLHQKMMFFWIILFVLIGTMMGFTAQSLTNVITTNPQFMNLILQLGGNAELIDSYFTMIMAFSGGVFAFYTILATLKLQSQESKKYSEMVLTNSVSRTQWAISNLIFAVLSPALLVILFALSMGLSYGLTSGTLSDDIIRILGSALVYLPAVWVFTGISMSLFGLVPRLAELSWVALAVVIVIDMLGEFFEINQYVLDISPFTHVPMLLAGDTIGTSLILLFVLSMVLIVIGVWGYSRRDVLA